MDLLSAENYVEAPFVILRLGEYTFGSYSRSGDHRALGSTMRVDFPNYLTGISVRKINGQVNTYTVNMVYAITETDDPNMMEKVFSTVRNSREMVLTYGDWNNAANIYKEESALITSIKSNVSMANSKITYTISGVSNSLKLDSSLHDFPARKAKPSDVIKELLYSPDYGLPSIFTGMTNKAEVNKNLLIASDDAEIDIEARNGTSTISYISYLVSCMTSTNDTSTDSMPTSMYQMAIRDDVNNSMGGPYFTVQKVSSVGGGIPSGSLWEIDVGFPGRNMVTDFSVENDESWSILYEYSEKIDRDDYVYRIGNDGSIVIEDSPTIMRSKRNKKVKPHNQQWWTLMTQFPITANITLKGLVKPTLLMDYVKLNVLFYGNRHILSGVYVIIQQDDEINSSGFRTKLRLLRIGGDTQ